MIRHFTASTVVLDDRAERVLLIHHRKSDCRLYPGGHLEQDEGPAQAAVREVREECGIDLLPAVPPFTHPKIRPVPVPLAITDGPVHDARIGPHRQIDFAYADPPGLPEELPGLIALAARHARTA
ncbi:NUDIX domain-containing protein [Actinomadura macrotermitis]|uniref:Nudix hydrolase domain-containing protein n=1 Tax=Actinomadura macrotermitis TaxID=2585200 RepID=A0A7K0C2I6_9ACTN|nr:NUDIX domain-containing protein [Actinomadura macrotermitis]MQY07641.1 hypothetical protein [Actinomadura macrotermitis]